MSGPLITEDYRAEQSALHATGTYGTASLRFGPIVTKLVTSTKATSLLDYGCGSRRNLMKVLQLPPEVVYEGYDPAVPEFSGAPYPADWVVCIDVLEHIEPSLLDNVLDHLQELCDPYGFFTIHCGPAAKVLSDGRNAHLIQENSDWWLPRLRQRFDVLSTHSVPGGFAVTVRSSKSQSVLQPPPPLRIVKKAMGPDTAPGEEMTEQASALGGQEPTAGRPSGLTQATIEYAGRGIAFNTPNGMTAWRVKTLFTKEPDTIRWIEGMTEGATLVDIGANVGMYSVLSSVARKVKVFAFEPESQNYALLNANIAANGLSNDVVAFPLALSDSRKLDRLYLSGLSAGGSCHSFAEQVGFDLKPRSSAFVQGAFSVTLDELVESGSVPVPDYIKIDVDGIEHKVLAGAQRTLSNPAVKELLVELNTHLPEHVAAIEMLERLGFTYDKTQADGALRKSGAFEGVGEFIFHRGDGPAMARASSVDRKLVTAEGILEHVMHRIAQTPAVEDPWPYMVVDDVFPQAYYEAMLEHFPSLEKLRPIHETGRVEGGPSVAPYRERLVVLFSGDDFARMTPAQQAFWRGFKSWLYSDRLVMACLSKFRPHLKSRLNAIVEAEKALKVSGDALLVNDRTNYAIGPHTDNEHRLLSLLFYLPKDNSMRELGTSVYRPKDPTFESWNGGHYGFELFDRVATIEYLPNRLLLFPKTAQSFHGVEPITRENINRPLVIHNVRLMNQVKH